MRAMPSTLKSVQNALRILHLLRHRGPLRLSEIAQETGLGSSTAHRLVTTLRAERFVVQNQPGKRYELGPAMLFTAGASAIEHCVTVAAPIIARLRDTIEETVHVSTVRGTDVVFLSSAESNRLVRVATRVGRHPKAHATAAGKVLLAALSEDRFMELYPKEALEALTSATIPSRARLRAEVDRAHKLGYARNLCESEPEMYTIAVPVRRPDGTITCALSISTPLSQAQAGVLGQDQDQLSGVEQGYLLSLQNARALLEGQLLF